MSDPREVPGTAEELPRAELRKKRRWHLPIVWLVPLVAAGVAGYVVYDRVHEVGPTITIQFKDADGIRAGETEVRYRGVTLGQVAAVDLSRDLVHVQVTVRLRRSPQSVALEGSQFWIVRPEVTLGNISGLGTVISGPYIAVLPGSGKAKAEFVGLETSPVTVERNALKIVLRAPRTGSLRVNSPVYYRGVEVGTVADTQLGADATMADIHVLIKRRYANLVRTGSKFWNASGADVSLGLFHGLEVKMESVRSLVAGGIAFATPNDPDDKPVKSGAVFPLHDEPKKEWLVWSPAIRILAEK